MSREQDDYNHAHKEATDEMNRSRSFVGELLDTFNVAGHFVEEMTTNDIEKQAKQDAQNDIYNPPN